MLHIFIWSIVRRQLYFAELNKYFVVNVVWMVIEASSIGMTSVCFGRNVLKIAEMVDIVVGNAIWLVINHFGIRKGLDLIIKNHRDWYNLVPLRPPLSLEGGLQWRWFPLRRTGWSQALGTRLDCNIYRTKAESTNFEDVSLKYNLNVTLLKMWILL